MRTFKPEELVMVTVVQHFAAAKRKPRVTFWAGSVVGPSVMGEGWYIVRPLGKRGSTRVAPFTVPWTDMTKAKSQVT